MSDITITVPESALRALLECRLNLECVGPRGERVRCRHCAGEGERPYTIGHTATCPAARVSIAMEAAVRRRNGE